MLNDIINEIKNKFNTTVPIDNVIQYVITAFNFGKLENSESFKFRRFNIVANVDSIFAMNVMHII